MKKIKKLSDRGSAATPDSEGMRGWLVGVGFFFPKFPKILPLPNISSPKIPPLG